MFKGHVGIVHIGIGFEVPGAKQVKPVVPKIASKCSFECLFSRLFGGIATLTSRAIRHVEREGDKPAFSAPSSTASQWVLKPGHGEIDYSSESSRVRQQERVCQI